MAWVLPIHPSVAGKDDAALARRLLAEGAILPLEHFIHRARAIVRGTLIDAELSYEAEHRAYVYEIRMLGPSGDVRELEFDAATGVLIEHEYDDD
ncbi:MAG: hypothetical protein K9L70_01400 [Thiohalocapsa sp.]|nr:hypothetical protein [Thiohalocapsa sp.]MCF7991198.1 hypothetical protein [Thiohalocapsa sp.]